MDILEKIAEAKRTLINLIYTDWKTNHLFSPTWWGAIVFILFSYFLCFKLFNKRRLSEIILFGSLITVMITLFDIIGVEYVRWSYTLRIFPLMPSLFLYDFTIVPLYFMLVYQYSKDLKTFIIWNAIASGIISFGVFPLMAALKMFKLFDWNYIYFFPCMFIFALTSRAIVKGILKLEKKQVPSIR